METTERAQEKGTADKAAENPVICFRAGTERKGHVDRLVKQAGCANATHFLNTVIDQIAALAPEGVEFNARDICFAIRKPA